MSNENETSLKEKWPPLPSWNPHWVTRDIHNIKRYTFACKNATNEYNLENPEYLEGVSSIAFRHLCWLIPIILAMIMARSCTFCYKPHPTLARLCRSCICLCVTSILTVACIQVLLYPLLTRIPPVYAMHAQDNDEVQNFSSNLDYKIDAVHESLKRAYTGDLRNVTDYSPINRVYAAIAQIQNNYDIFEPLQKRPPNYTDTTSFLSRQLLEDSWDYLKTMMFLWILALICVFIATILQPYCAGALCGVFWCCVGAITVTWFAVQLADACMIPTYPMRTPPYDWAEREMRSILKEYERVCREFAAEFAGRFSDYRERYEDALKEIKKVEKEYQGSGTAKKQVRDFAKAMYTQVDDAANDLMSNNITLSCQYNASSDNNHFPSHLPEYDRIIRYICHGSRKLQILILQILILMLAPIICFCILIYAILIMEPSPCPETPCPVKCEPCVETAVKSCSFTRQCGGIVPCSESDTCPGPMPKIPKGCPNYIRDQINKAQIANPTCNPVKLSCAIQPIASNCRTVSLCNPISSVQIRSGMGGNYVPATVLCDSTPKEYCVTVCKPIVPCNSSLDCSTSFSNTRLKLYPALISESKLNTGPTRFLESRATAYPSPISQSKEDICVVRALESKSTLFPSPISGSEQLIFNTSISGSSTFLPNIRKSLQETSVQSDTENETRIAPTIPEMKQSVCIEKVTDRDNLKTGFYADLKQKRSEEILSSKSFCLPFTSRRNICRENISKAASFSGSKSPPASAHSSRNDGDVTKLNLCPFSARLSQRDRNQKITKCKSGVFPKKKYQKKRAKKIFENKHFPHTSSTTLVSEQDVSDDFKMSVHSSREESKQNFPQIRSGPWLKLRYSKRQIKILEPKPIHCENTYCPQCGSHIESDLDAEEYLYFPPKSASWGHVSRPLVNKHKKDLIERKKSERVLRLKQFDPSVEFNQYGNVSRPIPGLRSLNKSGTTSNLPFKPLSIPRQFQSPSHSPTVKMKPAIKFPSKVPTEYHKIGSSESQSPHSLCSGCKSNIDFGSKVQLCVAPRSTSRVRICLTPTTISVVPGQSSFAAPTLCGNPKCTSGPKCVCKKKYVYSPTSGTPRKSILIKPNTPKKHRPPYQLPNQPLDIKKIPLTSILKKSLSEVSSSSKERNY